MNLIIMKNFLEIINVFENQFTIILNSIYFSISIIVSSTSSIYVFKIVFIYFNSACVLKKKNKFSMFLYKFETNARRKI